MGGGGGRGGGGKERTYLLWFTVRKEGLKKRGPGNKKEH